MSGKIQSSNGTISTKESLGVDVNELDLGAEHVKGA